MATRLTRYGLLAFERAAVELEVSVSTIRRWVHAGRLRPVRLGRRQFIRSADLAALIQEPPVQP